MTHPPHRPRPAPALELVLKADTVGTLDAATAALGAVPPPPVALQVIHRGVGAVAKSDLDLAATGSRLVLGFGVDVNSRVAELARELGVEVRLYEVIYDLARDAEAIARSLAPRAPAERITGEAKVIRLFRSSRRGIILGCEVLKGALALGDRYRVIAAPGPIHQGVVESLHIEDHAVREARVGQQVGLKIRDFKDAQLGDLVECFRAVPAAGAAPWSPAPGVHRARRPQD
ncbi:MAG: translation initiation factor IF-2 [Deferrisomatales bacterium]